MTNAIQNFKEISKELYATAQTDKARAFCEKITKQIEAKGEEWIISHETELGIHYSVAEQKVSAPVAENRTWFLSQWQKALW